MPNENFSFALTTLLEQAYLSLDEDIGYLDSFELKYDKGRIHMSYQIADSYAAFETDGFFHPNDRHEATDDAYEYATCRYCGRTMP